MATAMALRGASARLRALLPLRAAARPGGGARAASDLPRHLLPGAAPATAQQRAAAAEKYGLLPEDYAPFPDDGGGYGDYPKLPDRSQHERDPWYEWDYPDLRRNHGEPIHWNFDMFIRQRVDTSPLSIPWHKMRRFLWGSIAFMLVMFGFGEVYKTYRPVGPKQYPYNNLYLERGGDPSKEPPPEVKHYEI